jgi:hypothetical protein
MQIRSSDTGRLRSASQARVDAARLSNLGNLPNLEFSFPGQDGAELTGWSIYAEPLDKQNPLGPVRQVGDEDEGFSCLDDVARVALIYLTDFERTGDVESGSKARKAVEFCLNLEDGKGLFYNFVERDGRINKTGHTSFLGFTWWTARAFLALARAERVLGGDPDFAARVSGSLDRTVERMMEKRRDPRIHPNLRPAYERFGVEPGTLLDASGSITALFSLGLVERVRSGKATAQQTRLLEEYGQALVKLQHPSEHPFLGDLHLNSLNDSQTVHLYGNNQVQALCEAGTVLNRPDFIASARAEAERGLPRLLAAWMVPFGVSPSPEPFPQIAYSAECAVANLQAVYRATGEKKFSLLAGLYGSWFNGANLSGRPVYNFATGRAFDGVDPQGVSINSGAESNAEALLAMQALEGTPGAELARGLTSSQGDAGLKLHSGDDFRPSGPVSSESRGLNGGVQRKIWKLEPGGSLEFPPTAQPSWLVWHGEAGQELAFRGPQASGRARFDSPTHFDVDKAPPGITELKNEGGQPLWVESLLERPAQLTRSWTGPAGPIALTVAHLDTPTTVDDTYRLQLGAKTLRGTNFP